MKTSFRYIYIILCTCLLTLAARAQSGLAQPCPIPAHAQENASKECDSASHRSSIYGSTKTSITSYYSPNTYSLGRYGDVPVDYSTGKPNINIPLTQLFSGEVSVDISLNYYAGGIKVDQEAGTVGLGWNLCAGGMITRSVRGVPDSYNNKGEFISRINIRMEKSVGESNREYIKKEFQQIREAAEAPTDFRCNDPAPDVFYYNFCGKSGSFFLDEFGKGLQVRQNDFDVQMLCDVSQGIVREYFRIIDDQGTEYTFDATESFLPENGEGYTTSWYLSSIKTLTGNTITFTYKTGGLLATRCYGRLVDRCSFPIVQDSRRHEIPKKYQTQGLRYLGTASALILEKITSNSGARISFIYQKGRKDAQNNNGEMLTEVVSYNSLGSIIRRYQLSYDYFESDYPHKQPWGTSYDFLNYRLKLTSVQEWSNNKKDSLPAYVFSYYGDDNQSIYILPYRLSPCQDGWGYYNGSNNTCIFPCNLKNMPFREDKWYKILTGQEDAFWVKETVVEGGGDRTFNADAIKAGILKKIVYPTGGSTSFEYEGHEINHDYYQVGYGGLHILCITQDDGNGEKVKRTFTYSAPDEPIVSRNTENQFYTYYIQIIDDGIGRNRDVLAGYGVDEDCLDEPYILQIQTFPLVAFGLETEFVYPEVQETLEGSKKTVYEYSTYSLDYDSHITPWEGRATLFYAANSGPYSYTVIDGESDINIFPFIHPQNLQWTKGNLLRKAIYDTNGSLLREDKYNYEQKAITAVIGYKSVKFLDYEYLVACDYTFSGLIRLAEERHRQDGMETSIRYSYDNAYYSKPSSKTMVSSQGKIIEEQFRYPKDYAGTFKALEDANVVAVIDHRLCIGDTILAGEQYKRDKAGCIIEAYKYDGDSLTSKFQTDTPYTFSLYEQRSYDLNTHVLLSEKYKQKGVNRYYVWSYNNSYPVVSVETDCSRQIENLLALFQEKYGAKTFLSDADYEEISKTLSTFPNISYLLFKYLPSVGITKKTDERNISHIYEYDNFCRLVKKSLQIGNKKYLMEDYDIHIKP